MKCTQCGADVAAGKRFCTTCGTPAPAAAPDQPDTSLPYLGRANGYTAPVAPSMAPEQYAAGAPPAPSPFQSAPAAPESAPPPAYHPPAATYASPGAPVRPPGIGPLSGEYTAQPSLPSLSGVPDIDPAPGPQYPPAAYTPPPADYPQPYPAAAPPAEESDLIDELLVDAERKRKRANVLYKKPELWFGLATLLLVPAFFLPWLRLTSGASFDAFHLPLFFLITGQKAGVPFLSVGAALAILFAASAYLTINKKRILTYLRATAAVSILLALGVVMFSLRSWSMNRSDAEHFEIYEQSQVETLKKAFNQTDAFFGTRTDASGTAAAGGPPPTAGLDFLRRMFGLGALFAFLSGAAVFAATYVFASSHRFASYTLPATPTAIVIVFGSIALALFIIHSFFPAQWYRITATAYQSVGMRDAEGKALAKCTELPVPPPSCEMDLARLYRDTQRQGEAMALYRKIAEKYPNFHEVNKQIAGIYQTRHDFTAAVVHYRKFREKDKNDLEVNRRLADCLRTLADQRLQSGDLQSPIPLYREAFEINPQLKENSAVNLRMGEILVKMRNYTEAADYYKKAAALDARDAVLQKDAGAILEMAGRHEDAIAQYEKCITADKEELGCYKEIALIQRYRLQKPAAARETLERGLEVKDVGTEAAELKRLLNEM